MTWFFLILEYEHWFEAQTVQPALTALCFKV
jgi:hypothetical protein